MVLFLLQCTNYSRQKWELCFLAKIPVVALLLGISLIGVCWGPLSHSQIWRCNLGEERAPLTVVMGTGLLFPGRTACKATGRDVEREGGLSGT